MVAKKQTLVNTTRSPRSLGSEINIKLYWIQINNEENVKVNCKSKNVRKSQLYNYKNVTVYFHEFSQIRF